MSNDQDEYFNNRHEIARIWDTLSVQELAIVLGRGGALPPGSYRRRERTRMAMALIRQTDGWQRSAMHDISTERGGFAPSTPKGVFE